MSVVTIVAKVVARADAVETVKCELLKMIAPTRQEEGCLEYRLHQDNADPAVFLFYENWRNEACLESHLVSPHFRAYIAAVEGLIAEKVVHRMTGIA